MSNIYDMFDAHIGFSHGAEPIFIMRVAYTHIVSIGSAACQEPLGTMREAFGDDVKSYSADAQLSLFSKTIPLYTKHPANHDAQGVCAWCIVSELYTNYTPYHSPRP